MWLSVYTKLLGSKLYFFYISTLLNKVTIRQNLLDVFESS